MTAKSYDNLSNLTKEQIEYDLENYDFIKFNSRNNHVYSIYISKDSYSETRIHIWFEMFGKDVNCQSYEFVLENGYSDLTDELLYKEIPKQLKTYINEYLDILNEELELL